MWRSLEQALDSIFLSCNKNLNRLHKLGLMTKHGKEILHMDLRKVINIMLKKLPTCRWKSETVRSRKNFVLIEGSAWLN